MGRRIVTFNDDGRAAHRSVRPKQTLPAATRIFIQSTATILLRGGALAHVCLVE